MDGAGFRPRDPRVQKLRELLDSLSLRETVVKQLAGVRAVPEKRRTIAFKIGAQRRQRCRPNDAVQLLQRYCQEGRCVTLRGQSVVFELDGLAFPATAAVRFRGRRMRLVSLWLLQACRQHYDKLCQKHGAEQLDKDDQELLLGFLRGQQRLELSCEAPGRLLPRPRPAVISAAAVRQRLQLLQAEEQMLQQQLEAAAETLSQLDAQVAAAAKRHKAAKRRYADLHGPDLF